jgi:hypothetical protein
MSDLVAEKINFQACGNRKMSIPWRLWEITLCRINNWGHAPFGRSELQMLVCGAVGESERKALDRGFRTLIELGRIAPDSSRLCVVVDDDLWRRGGGKGAWEDSCSEPAHRDYRRSVWSAERGWEPGRRAAVSGTVTVPVPTAGVPVWTPNVPQWDNQRAW